ncbi:MAG TPA: sigma-70 family RNA polymerase sigma factor [Phycisphaerales bacterium]|nr:sigma-70 family RNA polymerase sigma factor [Phycisphaerales bacterium]
MDDLRTLLLRTHRGHEPSARRLWEAQAPRLVAVARAVLGRRGGAGDAEDAVQAVFCRVLELDRASVRSVRDPASWLAQMTRRESLNMLRSARRAAAREREHDGGSADGRAERDAGLAGALAALPRHLREVVVLRHTAGLTFEQVSLALGVNRNTVASRHRLAMERLRGVLAGGDGLNTGRRSEPCTTISNGA